MHAVIRSACTDRAYCCDGSRPDYLVLECGHPCPRVCANHYSDVAWKKQGGMKLGIDKAKGDLLQSACKGTTSRSQQP